MMVICLLVVFYTAHIEFMAYVMSFLTGLVAFTIGSPLQMMLITTAKNAETLAAAAGQASFNIGNTLGAFFGGLPIAMGFGYNTPVLIGVVMAFFGVVLSVLFLKMYCVKNV